MFRSFCPGENTTNVQLNPGSCTQAPALWSGALALGQFARYTMMDQRDMSPFLAVGVCFMVVLILMGIRAYRATTQRKTPSKADRATRELPQRTYPILNFNEKSAPGFASPKCGTENVRVQEMQMYKELYFKLQNLDQYPEILPQARDLLISMFSETLAASVKNPTAGILSVERYTRDGLAKFVQTKDDQMAQLWEEYLKRRRDGMPRELFQDREEAKWWLKQVAPAKYVDGAWLGHINKITTPFALRRATKIAWQVLSEELGDGDVRKNHVYVFAELMKEIGSGLPNGDTADFIHPRHNLNEVAVWKAAVAQLLISLFPHEFLPEILGFNLHFEGLTMETLKAAKELEELKFNAYYFFLHISIDNADSGHTMMALQAVVEYFEHLQATHGSLAVEHDWRRFQTGFILADALPTTPISPSIQKSAVDSFPRSECEAQVIKIIQAKAAVSHKIHCSSRLKLGGQALADWLNPSALASKIWQRKFLDELSNVKPWVRKGNSASSKLIQELSWGGKMFGSFTQREVEIFKRWIDAMRSHDPKFYWSFSHRTETPSSQLFQNRDITTEYPVFASIPAEALLSEPMSSGGSPNPSLDSPLEISGMLDMRKLGPLWFTHPCLLESFVSVPYKTTTVTACCVVRLMRAQAGFGAEGPWVDGMDEARRTDSVGLVELGLALTEKAGLSPPASLQEVLTNWPSEFALTMLHTSMRPTANAALLLGLAWAFVALHDALTHSAILSDTHQQVLRQIARRERDSLTVCLNELKTNGSEYAMFCKGYHVGKAEIERCF